MILFAILLVIGFAACCVLAKHGEEEEMVNEHQAIANLDKQVQLKELKDAVRKAQEEDHKND
jgi:hypothetical protein